MNSKKTIWAVSIVVLTLVSTFATFAVVFSLGSPPQFQPSETSHFVGQAEDSLISELGAPNHEFAFTMDECVGELRVILFNTYSPEMPGLAQIEIRELTWNLPNNKFTAWLHRPNGEWVILDTFRYETEAVF